MEYLAVFKEMLSSKDSCTYKQYDFKVEAKKCLITYICHSQSDHLHMNNLVALITV